MEEKVNSKMSMQLQYGLILSLAVIIYTLVLYYSGLMFETWAQYPTYLIIGLIIFFAQKKLAEINGNTGLSYGKALGFGVMIGVFSAIIVAVFNYLFYTIIAPEAIQQTMDMAEQKLIQQGLPDEQIEMALKMQEKFLTPLSITLFGIIGQIFIAFVLSLITSIFTKKEEQIFD